MATAPTPRPVIGILADFVQTAANPSGHCRVNVGYIDAVLAAGGLPLVIPSMVKEHYSELQTYLDMVNGVIVCGGKDLDPRRMGQPLSTLVKPMPERRESSDRYILNEIIERQISLLAIGSGMQLLNVLMGGSLFTHLPLDCPKAFPHFDPSGGPHRHMVDVEKNTDLEEIYGCLELRVNSTHHQAVNQVGKRLRIGARSPDGVIEAIESTDENWFCIGTQWHPEDATASALDRQMFDVFVQAAMKQMDAVSSEELLAA